MELSENTPPESAVVSPVTDVVSQPATQPATQPVTQSATLAPIVAGPGQYYRNTRYIMAVLTVAMGFWFGYDGFVRWPAEHKKIAQLNAEIAVDPDSAALKTELKSHTDHTETDILLQRVLAFSLPPLGILLLAWALYNSRGEYRLADDVLCVPGHPGMPLSAIRELDQTAWERKGIARVVYELADGRKGRLKLDDFVYDRGPTDLIYDRIRSHLQPPVGEAGDAAVDSGIDSGVDSRVDSGVDSGIDSMASGVAAPDAVSPSESDVS